jgi:uncharacterized membrane protein YphA (DoxX/SURF4 family)
MDIALWVAQILLGLVFVVVGLTHATRRDRATGQMAWMLDVPKPLLTTIGVLEILGGIALILPWATGIATFLTPLAAIAFVVLMVLAAVFHASRTGEAMNVVFNLVLGLVAAFIAWGRLDALPL